MANTTLIMHVHGINYHLDLAFTLFSTVILTKNSILTFLIVAPIQKLVKAPSAAIRGNAVLNVCEIK